MQQQDVIIERWRGIALILACFAVGLRLVIPAGFMPGVAIDGRMGLVICGPSASPHQQAPVQAPGDETPCAFTAHAVDLAGAAELARPTTTFIYAEAPTSAWRDLAPGRGLPAPPPPAIGPPLRDV